MNKRLFYLLLSSLIVVGLIFYGIRVVRASGSSVETELIDFAITETQSINRIVITDNYGRVMDLRLPKGSSQWVDAQGECVAQANVASILDACSKIEFKGYLTDNSVNTHYNIMVSKHIQVDYYTHGKWHKTWYIGPPSSDHLGQIMLLRSKEKGQSDRPVIMSIKGVHGMIEPRFFADPLQWKCTQIFAIPPDSIKKVDVIYPLEPARSFSVEETKPAKYEVRQQNIPIPNADPQITLLYLNRFKKIHYETANYILNDREVDSLKKTTPFCLLTVHLKNRTTQHLRMFRIPSETANINEFGNPVNYDVDRFWTELPNGEIVKCQHFVFDPLLLGHLYFPMDLSSLNLENYTQFAPEAYHGKELKKLKQSAVDN